MKNKMLAAVLVAFSLAARPVGAHTETGLSEVARAWLAERRIIVFSGQNAYPPLEYTDPATQEYSGLNVELIRWMASELGFTASFMPMTSAEAQNAVLDGRVDAITGISRNPGRESRFDFSLELFSIPASIFTRKERVDIRTSRDLEGKRIAIPRGDDAIEYLENAGITVDLVLTDDFRSAMSLVITGKADAMIGDEQIVLRYILDNQLESFARKASEPLYFGKDYIAVAKGDSILLSIIDTGIQRARESGTLAMIYKKWTGSSFASVGAQDDSIRSFNSFALLFSAAGSGIFILAYLIRRKVRSMIQLARVDLEKTVATLREENKRLAASNARLRRDVEERSRLEEEKRRIDAEVAARRVEELTRCAIAAALESTQADKGKTG